MPSTAGMKPAGYYDRHSSFQRATMEGVADWLQQAASELTLPAETAPITVADYGCSEGRNSILAVGHVVAALRQRRPHQPICAIHTDLPSNNFNQFFRNLHDPAQSNYFQVDGQPRPNVSVLACGGSFYGPLLPPRSVQLGMSFLALEWMDRVPDVPVPHFISYVEGSQQALAAFAQQAEQDLTRFLEYRAQELAPGGKLLIVIPGSDGPRRCSDGLYNVLNDAAWDLMHSGQISQQRFEQFVMPVYFRSVDEMTAPLTRGPAAVRDAFTIDRAEALHLPTPFLDDYRRTSDLQEYADRYTAFLRAFSEPVICSGLLEADTAPAAADALYQRIRERLLANPERYQMENIEVALLLTRK